MTVISKKHSASLLCAVGLQKGLGVRVMAQTKLQSRRAPCMTLENQVIHLHSNAKRDQIQSNVYLFMISFS